MQRAMLDQIKRGNSMNLSTPHNYFVDIGQSWLPVIPIAFMTGNAQTEGRMLYRFATALGDRADMTDNTVRCALPDRWARLAINSDGKNYHAIGQR